LGPSGQICQFESGGLQPFSVLGSWAAAVNAYQTVIALKNSIQTIQNDINDAVDTLNEIEKLEIQLAPDEVQRVLKIPIAHAAAVEGSRAKRALLSSYSSKAS
jgi:hypothetical protein